METLRDDLNLVPRKESATLNSSIVDIIMIYILTFLCLILFGVIKPNDKKAEIEKQIAEKEQELQQYATVDEEYEELTEKITEIKNNKKIVEQLTDKKKFGDILKDIQNIIPDDVVIKNLSYSDDSLTISATSSDIIDIAQFMVKLRQLDYVQSVKFSSASNKKSENSSDTSSDKNLSFNITVGLIENNTDDNENQEGGED